MNFLELCKRLRSEAGVAGSGPLTVLNQNEELERLVNWIKDAYIDIQDKRNDWDFLRQDFSFNTVAGTSTYAALTDLANWKRSSFRIYLTSAGVGDERWLLAEDWPYFRDNRLYNANRDVSGRPLYSTIKPDKSIVLWPKPTGIYTINGEYFTVAHEFVNDTDEPIFPRHHMAIVYNALMRYAAYVAEPSLYSRAEIEYRRLINKLERDYTQPIGRAGAMA